MMTMKSFTAIPLAVPPEDLCGMLDADTMSSLRKSSFQGRTYVNKFSSRCSLPRKFRNLISTTVSGMP
ncbi:MAG: hypothetical protein ACI9S8_002032 [Chlamydiales bacterium]|jgi:hypothetical protein